MPTPDSLKLLNRHVFLSSLASFAVLVIGLVGLVLYFVPSAAGVDSGSRSTYRGEIVWLVMGVVMASAGIAFLYILNTWPSELKKTVLHSLPVRMMVKLEVAQDSDSITYYAVISQRSILEGAKALGWRVHLWIYPPQITEDIGRQFECDVFFHAKTGLPVAIEYSKGMLWVIAGNGAVEKLSDHAST